MNTRQAGRARPPAFADVLRSLAEGRDLTREEAAWVLDQIVDGKPVGKLAGC